MALKFQEGVNLYLYEEEDATYGDPVAHPIIALTHTNDFHQPHRCQFTAGTGATHVRALLE